MLGSSDRPCPTAQPTRGPSTNCSTHSGMLRWPCEWLVPIACLDLHLGTRTDPPDRYRATALRADQHGGCRGRASLRAGPAALRPQHAAGVRYRVECTRDRPDRRHHLLRELGPQLHGVLRRVPAVRMRPRDRPHPEGGRGPEGGKRRFRLMPIRIDLDVMLARRKMKSKNLAAAIGISETNLSLLKQGHVRGIRFGTLEAICRVLQCQPGDRKSTRLNSSH